MNQRVQAPVVPVVASKPAPKEYTGQAGMKVREFSRKRHTGISEYSASNATTTAKQLSAQTGVFPYAYVIADLDNTETLFVGGEGGQVLELNAGDAVPYFDVSPSDIWFRSESTTSVTIHFQGFGDPVE